jgi:hypothetical protein
MHWNRGTRKPVSPSLPVARLASWLVCATVVIGLAPAGRANIVEFATGSQTLGSGLLVNASATFDINASSITVNLLNLTLNQTDVGQAIGFLGFTITGASAAVDPAMGANPASDTKLGIDSSGAIISPTFETTTLWQTIALSTTDIALCVICGGGGTTGLIIGGPDGSNPYGAGTLRTGTSGQWIIGSGPSGPLGTFDTSPDWLITFSTANLTNAVITNVIFGFGFVYGDGTHFGTEFIDVPVETPEPGSVILFGTGLGLLAIAAGARRLRRR